MQKMCLIIPCSLCVILLSIVEKRAQRYTFNSLLPNILANKFYLDSKKKVKGVWYPRIFRLIPVKRTEEVKGKNKEQPKYCINNKLKIDKYKCDSSQTTRRIEKSLSNYAFFQQIDCIAHSNLQIKDTIR